MIFVFAESCLIFLAFPTSHQSAQAASNCKIRQTPGGSFHDVSRTLGTLVVTGSITTILPWLVRNVRNGGITEQPVRNSIIPSSAVSCYTSYDTTATWLCPLRLIPPHHGAVAWWLARQKRPFWDGSRYHHSQYLWHSNRANWGPIALLNHLEIDDLASELLDSQRVDFKSQVNNPAMIIMIHKS